MQLLYYILTTKQGSILRPRFVLQTTQGTLLNLVQYVTLVYVSYFINGLPRVACKAKRGGGGGSRTRVRKYSTWASTYLSRILNFMLLVSSRQDTSSTSLLRFRRFCHRRAESTILLVDVLAGSAGKIRQNDGLIMRPWHIHNRLRLC